MYESIIRITATGKLPFAAVRALFDDEGALAELSMIRASVPAQSDEAPNSAQLVAIERLRTQLAEYAAGVRSDFELPMKPIGTPFQQEVWSQLCQIPHGRVVTYHDIAHNIGRPSASRAVGNANGRNPIPILIPCHRVVATSGLGGYSGGLDIKRALLRLEGLDPDAVSVPRRATRPRASTGQTSLFA